MKSLVLTLICLFSLPVMSAEPINFLIPGGEGGGWDTTARQTGQALVDTGLIPSATYQNFSGGGGGRALLDLVNNSDKYSSTLMVQSTPLVLRNITGVIKNSFRDIKPVRLMIAEFQVLVVPSDSTYQNAKQFIDAVISDPSGNRIIGGSAKGSLDHITAAIMLKSAGFNTRKMRYIPSDGGGDALKRLYSIKNTALVTGYGEIVNDLNLGKLRVLGISSEKRLPGSDIPTFKEMGYDVELANWRGFFAAPSISKAQFDEYANLLEALGKTPKWDQVREKYGWADFQKQGADLNQFLENQEKVVRQILTELDML